jgi:hypothetical protein
LEEISLFKVLSESWIERIRRFLYLSMPSDFDRSHLEEIKVGDLVSTTEEVERGDLIFMDDLGREDPVLEPSGSKVFLSFPLGAFPGMSSRDPPPEKLEDTVVGFVA